MEEKKIIIRPQNAFRFRTAELLEYREMIYFFAWRDTKIRYRHVLLGIIWAIVQPLFMALVFTGILHSGLKVPTGDTPVFLYFLSGIIVWNFFSQSVIFSTTSMLANAHIIRKVYFPRLAVPLAAIFTKLIDFVIDLIFFTVVALVYKFIFNHNINISGVWLALLLAFPVLAIFTTSVSIFLSGLNVRFRDVRNFIPYFIQIMFFLTPVIYTTKAGNYPLLKTILELNPLNFCIEIFRSNITAETFQLITIPWATVVLLIFSYLAAIYTFRKMEDNFADMI